MIYLLFAYVKENFVRLVGQGVCAEALESYYDGVLFFLVSYVGERP